ncbi:MAG: DUF4430 domain-containing protein [Candidatus Choladocola sp.]|nr:DUF4430 domain-containing protein [Candidatus Choladocola sp.]
MKTKTKKRLLNIIMVVLILIIAASGLMVAGRIRGWFGGGNESAPVTGKVKGVVNIERQGIGYTLNRGTTLAAGDLIETKKNAQAEFLLEETGNLVLNGGTELVIRSCGNESMEIEVNQGELFGDMADYVGDFELNFGGNTAALSESVFSVSVQSGSRTLYVYSGDVSLVLSDGTRERVEAGECLPSVDSADGSTAYTVEEIQVVSLNDFLISQAGECTGRNELCFSQSELQAVLDARESEKQASLEAALNPDQAVPVDGKERESETATEAAEEASAMAGTEQENSGGQSTAEVYQPDSDSSQKQEETQQSVASSANVCTITILCGTILNNMDNLSDGKEAYLPANGIILDTSSVEFTAGETVFDVLKRVCDYAGIQLEYSWTPMYNSYYVEGINHLYEFDCGNESGWMYKVNGWFPNYGCSSYELTDGDSIVWIYTCNGLGADVGGAAG